MKKCIEKLKVVEANRAAVVSELKEALQEQVGKTRSLTSYDAFSFFPLNLYLLVIITCILGTEL